MRGSRGLVKDSTTDGPVVDRSDDRCAKEQWAWSMSWRPGPDPPGGFLQFDVYDSCDSIRRTNRLGRACQHDLEQSTCPRGAEARRHQADIDGEGEWRIEFRLEWERRMREQQRCHLEDPSHKRKKGAPTRVPSGSIGTRDYRGPIFMYWDFGDAPPGIRFANEWPRGFHRTTVTANGEEVREQVVNIRCESCSLDEPCSGTHPDDRICGIVRQWRQQQVRLKAQQDMLLAWAGGTHCQCKRVRYRDQNSTGI